MVSPSRLTSKFGAVYSEKSLIVTALPPVVTGSMVTVPSPSAMLLPNAEIETLSVPAMVSVTVFPTATAVAMPVKSAPPSPSVALLAIASFIASAIPWVLPALTRILPIPISLSRAEVPPLSATPSNTNFKR